jgi:hypothetical protein
MKHYIPKHDPVKTQEEHKAREEIFSQERQRKVSRKHTILAICGVIVLILASVTVYSLVSPGIYDGFAKCLSEKGVVMYGEDWCPNTIGQKEMFGKSFKYVNYQIKTDLRIRPTWVIEGKEYETVQSFQRLAELTGCKY